MTELIEKFAECAFPSNAVAYWNFDESLGIFLDKVGGYVGTGSGIIYNASGKLNRCVEFDTNTDYITVPNNPGFVPTNDKYSISLWFKMDVLPSVAKRNYILTRLYDNAIGKHSLQISLPSDGNYLHFEVTNNTSTAYGTDAEYPFITGVWYHIVCVNMGSGIPALIYINGSNGTSWHSATFTGTILKANGTLRIGNISTSGTSAIDGSIDELGLWNRELLSTEVLSLYNSNSGLTYCTISSVTPTPTVTRSTTPASTSDVTPSVTPTRSTTPTIILSATPSITKSIIPTKTVTPTIILSTTPTITKSVTMPIPSPSTACTFPSGCVGYWKLDEISGSTLDSVNTNNGTLINSPTQGAAGKIGTCYTFVDTSSQSISMGEVSALKLPKLSVSAWFKATINHYDCIVSEINGSLSAGWAITTELSKLRCRLGDNATHAINIDGTTNVITGAWFHVVLTSDGTYGKMYINGKQEGGNVAFPYNLAYGTGSDGYFRIGARGSLPGQFFNGSIDEVGIWNRALTAAEVSTLYNSGNALAYCKKCTMIVSINVITG